MSVLWVNERFFGRPGNDAEDAPRTKARTFQAETDNVEDDSGVILDDPNIPEMGSEYPPGSGWIVTNRLAEPESDVDGNHWKIVVRYVLKNTATSVIESDWPWNKDPVINFSFGRVQTVLENAYAKDAPYSVAGPGAFNPIGAAVLRNAPSIPVHNSAKQPFDPPIMQERTLMKIEIDLALRHSNFDPNERLKPYVNTINKDQNEITIASIKIPQFTGFMQDIRAGKAWTQTTPERAYWNLHYTIIIDQQTHLYKIQDKGWFTLATTSADVSDKWAPILDTSSPPRRVTEAVLLDGNGQEMSATDTMWVIPYHGYWETTWANLIGDPLPAEH